MPNLKHLKGLFGLQSKREKIKKENITWIRKGKRKSLDKEKEKEAQTLYLKVSSNL